MKEICCWIIFQHSNFEIFESLRHGAKIQFYSCGLFLFTLVTNLSRSILQAQPLLPVFPSSSLSHMRFVSFIYFFL